MDDRLLREHIRKIIVEYDDLGGGYGATYGSAKDLYNVFVKPFTDVVSTAAAETKRLSQHTQTLMSVAYYAIVTSLVPIMNDEYDSIFQREAEGIEKIKSQYKEVYDATYTAFKDEDIYFSAFLYAPQVFLASKAALKAPAVTATLMNVFLGGRLDSFVSKVHKALKFGDTMKPLQRTNGLDFAEGLIRESSDVNKRVAKALHQDKLLKALNQSQKASQVSQNMQKVVNGMLSSVVKAAKQFSSVRSIDEIEKLTGKKIKDADKIRALKPEERKIAAQELAKGMKTAVKKHYVMSLKKDIQKVMNAGFTEDHPFVTAYKKAISQIDAL